MKRLAIISTHPIQYNAPVFQLLSRRNRIDIKVFYTWGSEVANGKYDPGFGKKIEWDLPLLEGYDFEFVQNTAKQPGSGHFFGIQNPTLKAKLKDWKPDALLVFGWCFRSHLHTMVWAKGRYKILFRGDSTLLNEKNKSVFRRHLKKHFLHWVYRHIDYGLYVGQANKKYYEHLGVKNKRLIHALHAVDNSRFSASEECLSVRAKEWRVNLDIRSTDTVFLFAGKLETVKNPLMLLEAFMKLGLPHCHLIFCGCGPLEEALRKKAGNNATVHFIGFQNQSQMPVVYRLADVFVLPSISETWGLSVNEAMASSRAVLISTRCGCAIDLVKEGVNGYTFDPSIENDLCEKLKRLYQQKNELKKMGEAGEEISRDFSMEKITNAIEQAMAF